MNGEDDRKQESQDDQCPIYIFKFLLDQLDQGLKKEDNVKLAKSEGVNCNFKKTMHLSAS